MKKKFNTKPEKNVELWPGELEAASKHGQSLSVMLASLFVLSAQSQNVDIYIRVSKKPNTVY